MATPENEWITPADVAEWLGPMATDSARLDDATAAAKWYVEVRRSDLRLRDPDTVTPADVKLGTVIYAALIYQQRVSPTGYAAYGDGALDVSGDTTAAYMRSMRLIGLRRPVAIYSVLVDTVASVLDEITAALAGAGLDATRDPAAFQPPGAIIAAPTLRDATLGGVLELEVPIYCVTGDPGQTGLDELLGMIDVVRMVFGVYTAEPAVWTSPLNPAGLPAYRIPLSATAHVVDVEDPTTTKVGL